MRTRSFVLAGVLVVGSAGGVANAATHNHSHKHKHKPVCNLVKDAAGDAPFDPTGAGLPGAPQDANADILSADISSNMKALTAVIRLKSLASPDTSWPEAHFYMLSWVVPGHSSPVYLGATIDPNPASAAYGPQFVFGDGGEFPSSSNGVLIYYNVSKATVKGTVDTAKNTITLSVPISQLKGYGTYKPGTTFSAITVGTQQLLNGPVLPTNVPGFGGSAAFGFTSDSAVATKSYVAGTPSCVKPGS